MGWKAVLRERIYPAVFDAMKTAVIVGVRQSHAGGLGSSAVSLWCWEESRHCDSWEVVKLVL